MIHAAGESTPVRVPRHTSAVALHARDEAHLCEVGARLRAAQIPHHEVIEEDGPHAGHLMAIGLEPSADRAAIRKVTSDLPLVA